MSRAGIFALLAFVTLGAAGGALIVGDPVWFAWSAGIGAVALIIWGRTHDRPAGPLHLRPSVPAARVCCNTAFGEMHAPLCDPAGDRAQHVHAQIEQRRPVWATDVFGAPE